MEGEYSLPDMSHMTTAQQIKFLQTQIKIISQSKTPDSLKSKYLTELIKRRGPDSKGYFCDNSNRIYKAYRN